MVRLAILALVLVAGCTGPAAAPTPEETAAETVTPPVATPVGVGNLRSRPLVIPTLAAGSTCPVTTFIQRPDPDLGPILGDGPAGPVGLLPGGRLRFKGPDEHTGWVDTAWGGQKVLWAVDPRLGTPVLVRGRQLDGSHQVRFNDPASPELILAPEDSAGLGWRDYPGHTRLQAPGCYAFQVDSSSGRTVIVFTAEEPVVD